MLNAGFEACHCESGTHDWAGANSWGAITLPASAGAMELLWSCCKDSLSLLHEEGYPDVLAQGVDAQTVKLSQACSINSQPVRANVCVGGFNVDGLLKGGMMGDSSAKWSKMHFVQMGDVRFAC